MSTPIVHSVTDANGVELHGEARQSARHRFDYKRRREKKLAYNKRYYQLHAEHLRQKSVAYRKVPENRQRLLNYCKRYYREVDKEKQNANPAKRNARIKAWKLKNPAKVTAMDRRRRLNKSIASDKHADRFYLFVRSQKRIPCYYCGKKINGKDAHIDHVIALSKSGNHSSQNLCCSCKQCNLRKFNNLPSEITFLSQPLLNL